MKIRQAKKIMKNIRLYPGMLGIYGVNRVNKANKTCVRHYARADKRIKTFTVLFEQDPLAAIQVLQSSKPIFELWRSNCNVTAMLRRYYGKA